MSETQCFRLNSRRRTRNATAEANGTCRVIEMVDWCMDHCERHLLHPRADLFYIWEARYFRVIHRVRCVQDRKYTSEDFKLERFRKSGLAKPVRSVGQLEAPQMRYTTCICWGYCSATGLSTGAIWPCVMGLLICRPWEPRVEMLLFTCQWRQIGKG